jgi:hypothetical protein
LPYLELHSFGLGDIWLLVTPTPDPSSVIKKIAFLLVPFLLGIGLAKSEKLMAQESEMTEVVKVDPRKNYRRKLAKQYFGHGGGRCQSWKGFCGR